MSGVKVIRNLLVNNGALIAIVPEARILAGVVGQGASLPAIAINEISRVERHNARLAGPTLVTCRVQATVMAPSYPAQKQILDAIGAAVTTRSGVVQGVTVDSILRDVVGPDMRDDDAGIYMQSRDFIVRYIESH
jgi:hypothetical protein